MNENIWNSLISKLKREDDILILEQFFWKLSPGIAFLRKNTLFICYFKEEAFTNQIRSEFINEETNEFNGVIVRYWLDQNGKETFNYAVSEEPVNFKNHNSTKKQKMSNWEFSSFGCQVFSSALQKNKHEVLALNSSNAAPPQVWFKTSEGISVSLIKSYLKSDDKKYYFPELDLIYFLANKVDIKENLKILVSHIQFIDVDNDPFDPRFNRALFAPMRRSRLAVYQEDKILNDSLIVAEKNEANGLKIYS